MTELDLKAVKEVIRLLPVYSRTLDFNIIEVAYKNVLDEEMELLMAKSKKMSVSVKWTISDIQQVRPDLDDDQAMSALEYAVDCHDANVGINWTSLEAAAEALYGEALVQCE